MLISGKKGFWMGSLDSFFAFSCPSTIFYPGEKHMNEESEREIHNSTFPVCHEKLVLKF
jgi:hypothetical protein